MSITFAASSLGPINDASKQKLAQVLWGWKLCGQCISKPSCSQFNCPWNQFSGLYMFWKLYERMTDTYSQDRLGGRAALESHDELLEVVLKIKSGQATPRNDLLREIFEVGCTGDKKPPTLFDQDRAFKIGASVVFLMDFGTLHDAANLSTGSTLHVHWRDGVSANNFIKEAFPRNSSSSELRVVLANLKANKLAKNAKVRFRSTNDIRRHLVLDRHEGIVWIFHHTTVLRAALSGFRNSPDASVLPRQVMLEVLDTIHAVLFPPELGPQELLAELVLKNSWDMGLLSDISIPYRAPTDSDVSYVYFGDRLEELYKELQSPTPHGWLQRRLQRKSETYMLMATMYGVLIAVTLGFLSLVAAVFQAWVAWQQWQHPVQQGPMLRRKITE